MAGKNNAEIDLQEEMQKLGPQKLESRLFYQNTVSLRIAPNPHSSCTDPGGHFSSRSKMGNPW